jgi:hypothetical protein
VRDGIVLIGVLLDHHGEIMIVRPAALRPAVFRPSLLPSSIQLLRCTAEAVPRVALGPASLQLSAGRWALARAHGSGGNRWVPDTRRRLEDQPANRRWSRAWDPVGRPGVGPGLFDCCEGCCRSQRDLSADEGGGDEETRTPDPLLAKEMLCQLSYVPGYRSAMWWAHLDSNQGPRPYQGRALTS